MGFVHSLADRFIIIPLQRIADVQHPTHFTDDETSPFVILLRDFGCDLFEHRHIGVTQELHMRVLLLHGSDDPFARLSTFVVGRINQFVFHA